ncbi:hypothetical protein [Cylindrospermum stagnale]|nr:hypothetical protein [Cylindrospermum stagnale]
MEEEIRERVQYLIDFGYQLLATKHQGRTDLGTVEFIQDTNRFYEWEL